MKISLKKYLIFGFIAFLTFFSNSRAQIIQYQGSSLGNTFVSLGGSLGVDDINFSNIANPGTLNTTLNASALTLTYNSVSILTGGGSGSVSNSITTGFGQSSTITANVTFNPFSYSLNNIGTASLTPSTGGNYTLSSLSGTDTLTFSGNYSITDGTNTYNGTFSTPITTGYTLNYLNADTLYSAGYPNSIQIGASGVSTFRFFDFPSNAVLFSQQFGSSNVQVTIQTVVVQTGNMVTLSAAPEPSTWMLLWFGLCGLVLLQQLSRRNILRFQSR